MFHILTPYPGTPLFARLQAEGRLLHTDWSRYDTATVAFRPRHLTPEQLAEWYAWCYRRLFSARSIWRRRPSDPSAVLPYLAMSALYKRSNWLWHLLIRHRLTGLAWRPLVEWTRRRHLGFRRRFEVQGGRVAGLRAGRRVGGVLNRGRATARQVGHQPHLLPGDRCGKCSQGPRGVIQPGPADREAVVAREDQVGGRPGRRPPSTSSGSCRSPGPTSQSSVR